ncbi:GTPase IMAP family member 2, partial [Ophiophagus hannah]
IPGFVRSDLSGHGRKHPRRGEIVAEVRRCVPLCSPGPHVILHVMHPFHARQKETDVVERMKEIFGLEAKDYTIILFTHQDFLKGRSLEEFISSGDKKVKEYLAACGNRCLAFNNTAEGAEREAALAELMSMIDALVERNRRAPCYTEDRMHAKKPRPPYKSQRDTSLKKSRAARKSNQRKK